MISTIGRTVNQEIIIDFPLEYIQTNELEWYWVDIGEPTKEEEQLLSSFFHFHPLAIEDCLQMLQRLSWITMVIMNFLFYTPSMRKKWRLRSSIFCRKGFCCKLSLSPYARVTRS